MHYPVEMLLLEADGMHGQGQRRLGLEELHQWCFMLRNVVERHQHDKKKKLKSSSHLSYHLTEQDI